MRFRKAVFPEAEYLLEDLLRELFGVAAREHAVDQSPLERLQPALAPPRRHRAPQLIGLAGSEARGHHGELHHLLLEDGDPQRALEHRLHRLGRIGDRLLPAAAAQIGMHHAALDRPRPDDRHFDHEIVEPGRLQARQHRHLRPRFHLEHADRIGLLQHRVDLGVFGRDVLHPQRRAAPVADQIERAADGREHAQRQHVHLEYAERIEVVLVPLDDGARRHRGVFDGHQAVDGAARHHEAAHVLRQVARKPAQRLGDAQQPLHEPRVRIEAGFAQSRRHRLAAIPEGEVLRDAIDLGDIEPERLAGIAKRAAAAIADDGGGDRGALAAIARVDVLDHFLALLVLEVDVDVGRLVALLRDEAFEQHRHARRIDLGDAERKAHRRIGRRAAALAQDALAPRERHDVVHREEVGLVAEIGDERELALDRGDDTRRRRGAIPILIGARLPGRRPAAEPPLQSPRYQLAQPTCRCLARGHDLLRIFVAQRIERERAAGRDGNALGQQPGWIKLRELVARAQVPLAIGKQPVPRARHRHPQPDGRQHILQRAASAGMHVDIVARHQRHTGGRRERLQLRQPLFIVRRVMQLDCDPKSAGKPCRKPRHLRSQRQPWLAIGRHRRWNHDHQAPRQPVVQVIANEVVFTLLRTPPPLGDQGRQVAVALAILRQQHQLRPVGEPDLAADDQMQAVLLRPLVRPHDARERAFVGDGERRVAELRRALGQLIGVRGPAQEGEVADAVEFGEGGRHGRWPPGGFTRCPGRISCAAPSTSTTAGPDRHS